MVRTKCDIVELLTEKSPVRVCAPMVRYSKLEFRTLVRKYGCQLCFTPMIMSNCFIQSPIARNVEFSTNESDSPVIVQFAANCVDDFVEAAQLVYPYCDGVDLNCGCPQRWAMKDGYGADLLRRPEQIRDMVRQVRNKLQNPFSVSIKVRVNEDVRKTVSLCQSAEAAGVSFISVHGRTVSQRGGAPDRDKIATVAASLRIPVIANGDIKTRKEAEEVCHQTGAKGSMVADALLRNPGLFADYESTPVCVVEDWVSMWLAATDSADDDTPAGAMRFQTFHHHLVFMLEKLLSKEQRLQFNYLTSTADVVDFLKEALDLPGLAAAYDYPASLKLTYDHHIPPGSYFTSIKNEIETSGEDIMEGLALFGE